MIAKQTFQNGHLDMASGLHGYCGECRQRIAEAEREMGAFIAAVARTFGSVAATRAAKYWIELAENPGPPLVDGCPKWRELTVMASSRLALSQASLATKRMRESAMRALRFDGAPGGRMCPR